MSTNGGTDLKDTASASSGPAEAAAGPVMRLPGERFPCRISVEDFEISVETTPDISTWGTKLCWEELQIRCEYSGDVKKTRWMPLPLAFEQQKQKAQSRQASTPSENDEEGSAGEADSSIHLDDIPGGAGKPRILKLIYSVFNDCAFEVEFTSGNEETPGDANGATRRVRRKKTHHLDVCVEAQNLQRLFSTTGGRAGDQKPTSASKEAINAAFQKGAAKLSAWARGAFSKKSSAKELQIKEREKLEEEALMRGAAQAPMVTTNNNAEGTYRPVALPSIDPSEAYNAPGGRKRYQLILKADKSKLPQNGEGVPLLVAFTVVAHFKDESTSISPRNFHDFVFVMDQLALNASEAAEVSMTTKRRGNGGDTEEVPRRVVGYGFAFTTNTAHSEAAMATSKIVSLDVTRQADGHYTRVIDFAAQHRSHDERQLCADDYQDLPTTACIVSSDCQVASPERVGHRVLCVSRYKTSKEGLCKPSYKCQVTFTLTRQYDNGDVEQEKSESPINLSAMLNQELFTSRDREVRFSLGEILYMRFRRFCFANPELNVAPLLLPFDYDNTGVVIRGACGPVSSWTRRKSSAGPRQSGAQQGSASDAGAIYGADEVGPAPEPRADAESDAASTDSSEASDRDNPFYKSAALSSQRPPQAADDGLTNPFATQAHEAGPTVSEPMFTFTPAGPYDVQPPTQDAPAQDDFFMDGWGTEPTRQAHDVSAQGGGGGGAGSNMFASGPSHVYGSQDESHEHAADENTGGAAMFSTESSPAFVLEPMPGEDNALDWTKWGQ